MTVSNKQRFLVQRLSLVPIQILGAALRIVKTQMDLANELIASKSVGTKNVPTLYNIKDCPNPHPEAQTTLVFHAV
jgi:hypothetical protein